ncbi:MGDG synthase family glycosyltransferase [Bacillus atrophaeus]|uniref:MGDG synthase family glycosyltransferase n=1 Tax=Bacillus atrophaeus TaxID=1452 RepID=UPI00227E20CE|nr:glycosyltransferase [Bacillus atrophaeus]MCY8521440.1 glycosyltransferase [Bacillus atrophaeus]MCY8525274.1 glycosyltransferase [Bacillus atrophaeus]
MTNILIFPFLSISTGHHHAADSLQIELSLRSLQSEKIDIFSHRYKRLEKLSSITYLKWIQHFPKTYSWIYHLMACGHHETKKRYVMYEWLFLKSMKQLIKEKQPDLVFCTHALPSYLLNQLKREFPAMKVVNVYTDFFVNQVWGRQNIDYHFVPIKDIKEQLIAEGVDEGKIFLTGIPIDRSFTAEPKLTQAKKHLPRYTVMITGGSMGVGGIFKLIKELSPGGNISYQILCGKNEKLYRYVKSLHNPLLEALPYIHSKAEINHLYQHASGIITKPGGVTVSECIEKKLPTFIYHALPGQEEMNLNLLKKRRLVISLENWKKQPIEDQLLSFFQSSEHVRHYQEHVSQHLLEMSDWNIREMIGKIIL